MHLRLLFLSFISIFLLAQTVFSQPICGFDLRHQQLMREDPVYRKNVSQNDANIRKYILAHKKQLEMRVDGTTAALYTIPVVVHIVHTGGAIGTIYNPTDAQITGAINYLNSVYNGTYPTLNGGVGDLQIQFALAVRDPNCNPTNGINRVNGSGLSGYVAGGVTQLNDTIVKNLIRWPTTDYYNIWIVNKINGADGTSGQFVAGYAHFPGGNVNTDGTVMIATQMKAGQKTLPHEIGHAFNLYHPFEGSTDVTICPANNDCSLDGDQVCDTDPISENLSGGLYDFTCRTGTNTCVVPNAPYNANTENNFMNYTFCYTLFTAGQKARMLASAAGADRFSLSTSLGLTPTTDVSNPCPPKINFEYSEGQATEATATTSGCRAYKDYSYNMTIGNDPSQAATATLNIAGGTATESVDFDITTNGSFSSPSKTLNFPAGSHGNQSFTIRIYDDAIVESPETFTLGFTVNSGGGNAVQGDSRTSLLFTISDNDMAPYGGPLTSTKSIGGYTANLNGPGVPLSGSDASQKSQLLYRATELNAVGAINPGNITGLAFNITKNTAAGFVFQGLTIKMGLTTVNGFAPQNDAGYTTVYSGNYSTVNGLNSFTFSTPFAWDGTSNIVVEICYDNGTTTSPADDSFQGYSDGGGSFTDIVQSGINCTASYTAPSAFSPGIKPNIQFIYADSGTPVQTVLNSSKQEYLGPNADVYFYDQSTNKLLARISNSTAFDYGCTQVFIDRNTTSAGSNSVAFWNNTPANYLLSKTLKVVPTTNNPSGSYQISLYYTQAEINAWQTATGQSISNAQVVKVASQISDVTPANPSGGGTVTIATPAVTSLGTNTVLTASFTNGFSGFGAGVAGSAALPVRLLDFAGRLIGNSVLLEWSTSSEINSQYFDIERSADGIVFNKIGTVNAAGNSSTIHNYSFTDAAAVEHNYYRLKQVDIDGKFEYSKVIIIDNKNYGGNFRVINNPFTDVLDIDFGKVQAGKTDIRLLDVTGKEIYHTVNDVSGLSRVHINLSGRNLSAGIYLLQVNTNHGQFIARVMKQ